MLFEVLKDKYGWRRLAADVCPIGFRPLLPHSPLRGPLAQLMLDRLLQNKRLRQRVADLHRSQLLAGEPANAIRIPVIMHGGCFDRGRHPTDRTS